MSAGFASSLARTTKRCSITIPAAAGSGGQLLTLCGLTTAEIASCLGLQIHAKLADGTTDRPAILVSDVAAMTNASAFAAGQAWYEPTIQACNDYVKAASGGTITAQVSVYLS